MSEIIRALADGRAVWLTVTVGWLYLHIDLTPE